MYLLKNAFKSVTRSLSRNTLIGLMVFLLSFACCVALSIQESAEQAKTDTLETLTLTAQLSFDRQALMQGFSGDRDQMKEQLGQKMGLSVEEMKRYAEASSVAAFHYTATLSLNGTDSFEAIASDTSSSTQTNGSMMPEGLMRPEMPSEDKGGFKKGGMGQQGEFTVIGYSSDQAMTDFLTGQSTVVSGQIFEEGTSALEALISEELALYNELEVGDTFTVSNPNQETETYDLTVIGIYETTSTTSSDMMHGFSPSSDPANQIYLSYEAVQSLLTQSEAAADVSIDETTGMETTTAMPVQENGTYVFTSVEDYDTFKTEVYDLGLDESYQVSSSDLTAFEQQLLPLEQLSQMAGYFLILVIGIGAFLLVILTMLNVRERKYEIGVLTAIGMKKSKVAIQFFIENAMVTFVALLLGAGLGAGCSVPITNTLLASQIEAQTSQSLQQEQSFGRPMGDSMQRPSQGRPDQGMNVRPTQAVDYLSEISSATNLTVVCQLLGLGVLLTLVASGVSLGTILRYDPLKILSNRD